MIANVAMNSKTPWNNNYGSQPSNRGTRGSYGQNTHRGRGKGRGRSSQQIQYVNYTGEAGMLSKNAITGLVSVSQELTFHIYFKKYIINQWFHQQCSIWWQELT